MKDRRKRRQRCGICKGECKTPGHHFDCEVPKDKRFAGCGGDVSLSCDWCIYGKQKEVTG